MNVARIGKTIEKLASDNAPTILTVVGAVGTVATAYLTGKATVTAVKKVEEKKFIKHLHEPGISMTLEASNRELSKTETFKLVWLCYIPPVAAGVTTVAAIVFANRISAKRMAALAAGYGLLDNRFEEYKTKMQEKLGMKKEHEATAEIAKDRVDQNPPDATLIISDGKALFKDEPSGRYFESTMEDIRRAENDLNKKIMKDEYAVLTDWYDLIGLAPTSISEEYGWEMSNDLVEIAKSAVITQDGRPCICLDYNIHPIRNGYSGGGGTSKMRAV